ncbi:MAG: glycosyl transferase family 4 [Chloroflexi bacterium]|nr:glycosyl transferase family 4 [Chloroflexota bacterium]
MTIELWLLLVLVVAAGSAVPLVVVAESLGRRLGLVDLPRRGEVQRHSVPRTGGYGVWCAFWLTILVSFIIAPPDLERLSADNWRLVGVLLGAIALLPLAAVDDLRRLGPGPQIVGQAVAATIPVLFGLRMEEIATPWGIVGLPDALAIGFAILWIVSMINAINLIDSMDGLAGGITSVASLVLFVRTLWFGQASIAVLPLALCGASFGFLVRNWHPSRVFLGSSGALFLGYMLGVITLVGGAKIGTAFLVLAVPILDVAWVAYRRVSQGRSPFRGGDAEHLPHRLRLLGMSDPAIVLSLYGVCAAIGAAVLFMHSTAPTIEKAYLGAVVVLGVLALLAVVARVSTRKSVAKRPLAGD